MSYSTSLPGLDEARLVAVHGLLSGALATLNAALAVDSQTPMSLTSGQITIGDTGKLEATRISVVGGGEHDATDMEVAMEFVGINDVANDQQRLFTNVFVRLHPNEFVGTLDGAALDRARELARARICDTIRRRILGAPQNRCITLTSREHATSPDYDVLGPCWVRDIRKGYEYMGYGNTIQVLSAQLVHVGIIQ